MKRIVVGTTSGIEWFVTDTGQSVRLHVQLGACNLASLGQALDDVTDIVHGAKVAVRDSVWLTVSLSDPAFTEWKKTIQTKKHFDKEKMLDMAVSLTEDICEVLAED